MRILDSSRSLASRPLGRLREGLVGAGVWILALVAIELTGRQTTSDLADALAVLVVLALVLLTARWQAQLGWVRAAWRKVRRGLEYLADRQASFGIDFRAGSLDVFGYPRLLKVLLLTVLGLAVLASLWPNVPIRDLREMLATRFYVGYLAVLLVVWIALVFLILTTLLLFGMLVHDSFVARCLEPRRRSLRPEFVTLAISATLLAAAAVTFDASVALWIQYGLLGGLVVSALLPVSYRVKMVWKSKATKGTLRAVSVRWLSTTEGLLLTASVSVFVMIALGNILVRGAEPISETTPVTEVLGRILAWTGALGGGSYLLYVLAMLWVGFRLDPRKPNRPTVHFTGLGAALDRRHVRRMYDAIGWSTRFAPTDARRADVCVEVVAREESAFESPAGRQRWPLRVARDDLARQVLHRALARRDQVQKRRRLVKGLERMFKLVSDREFERGAGYWVGAHHWFVLGLSRDESESTFDLRRDTWMRQHIGPSFESCIDWPARQHLHHVLWCLDVDLIFVEDGVGFRGLRRVLRMLFDLYDTFGATRRLEERMLVGMPGIRAIIQEVGLEKPLDSKTYPEPDYEDIGRARVLHLFKDRGGDVEPVEIPTDFEGIPVLTH